MMEKIYYNKIVRKDSTYTLADIPSVSMQQKVLKYAQAQVIAGKLSEEDYDAKFAAYEAIYEG